jgi:hypothetical protein
MKHRQLMGGREEKSTIIDVSEGWHLPMRLTILTDTGQLLYVVCNNTG